MSTREQRGYQMFPVLNVARLETALRFASGPERHSAPGEILYDHGQQGVPSWLVLSGSVDIIRHRNWGRSSGGYRCLPIDTEGYDGLAALPIVSVAPVDDAVAAFDRAERISSKSRTGVWHSRIVSRFGSDHGPARPAHLGGIK